MNRQQNQLINKLISDSNSFLSGSEGNDVAVFAAEGDIQQALIDNGFTQNIRKDKFGLHFGHTAWWNESAQLLVTNTPQRKTWTVSTEKDPLFASDFVQP